MAVLLARVALLLFTYACAHSLPLNEEELDCVDQFKLNRNNVELWNVEPLIPEDNKDMVKYMGCYWKKLGYLGESGEIDFIKLGEVVHADLKGRFRTECLHIVAFIMENCKEAADAKTEGLRAVKMWNCLNAYTENLF